MRNRYKHSVRGAFYVPPGGLRIGFWLLLRVPITLTAGRYQQ